MKCFYHSADLDGHCSGAIVERYHRLYRGESCEMIGIDYDDPFPWDTIDPRDVVFMVDFSLQPFEDMARLDRSCRLVWIDHHKSAMEAEEAYLAAHPEARRIRGVRQEGRAGCELAWGYLYQELSMPRAVELLGRYDVWDHRDPVVLPFQYGMRLYADTRPEQKRTIWDGLLGSEYLEVSRRVKDIVHDGHVVQAYLRADNAKYCRANAFATELDGMRCLAVNRLMTNSQLFEALWDPCRYEAMIAFGVCKGRYVVSLYSDRADVDCSAVCKARGGGGHKGAAGFSCDELPFAISPEYAQKGDGQ